MPYQPTADKLAALGFVNPDTRTGLYPSVTYHAPGKRAVVLWPKTDEVRLAVGNPAGEGWLCPFTGSVADEAAFDALLAAHGFAPQLATNGS